MTLSLVQQFDRFADRFLPPDNSPRPEPDDKRREQMFVVAHLASPFCVAILAAMLYGLAGVDTPPLFGIALGFATFYAYPFLLKRVFSFRTASYLSTAQFTVLIFFTVYFFGGWDSFALPWFASVPMAGMLFLGFRGAYTTSALAASGLLALLSLSMVGHGFSNPLPGAWQSPMMMASIGLCIAFNTGIAFLHVRLHNFSHNLLRNREAQSRHVQKMARIGSWEIDYERVWVGGESLARQRCTPSAIIKYTVTLIIWRFAAPVPHYCCAWALSSLIGAIALSVTLRSAGNLTVAVVPIPT